MNLVLLAASGSAVEGKFARPVLAERANHH
jgi:hypothetical protein